MSCNRKGVTIFPQPTVKFGKSIKVAMVHFRGHTNEGLGIARIAPGLREAIFENEREVRI
jgi:hypothetical protein